MILRRAPQGGKCTPDQTRKAKPKPVAKLFRFLFQELNERTTNNNDVRFSPAGYRAGLFVLGQVQGESPISF